MKGYKILFYGTHKDNVESFRKHGLKANSSISYGTRGSAFLSPRPDVAFAYAVMGGETNYKKGKNVSDKDRALIIFKIPEEWYKKYKVSETDSLAPEVGFKIGIPAKFIDKVIIGDRKKVYSLMQREHKLKSFKEYREELNHLNLEESFKDIITKFLDSILFVANEVLDTLELPGNIVQKYKDNKRTKTIINQRNHFVSVMTPEKIDSWEKELRSMLKSQHPRTVSTFNKNFDAIKKQIEKTKTSKTPEGFKRNLQDLERQTHRFRNQIKKYNKGVDKRNQR